MESEIEIRDKAEKIVRTYIATYLKVTELFWVSVVWQAQVLEHWRFGLITTLDDGRYYELIYNPQTLKWSLDVYKKEDTGTITDIPVQKKEK